MRSARLSERKGKKGIELTRDENLPVVCSLGVEDWDEVVVLVGDTSGNLLVVGVLEASKEGRRKGELAFVPNSDLNLTSRTRTTH